jgi:hypothetical protein
MTLDDIALPGFLPAARRRRRTTLHDGAIASHGVRWRSGIAQRP